jgi:hypothetical protein
MQLWDIQASCTDISLANAGKRTTGINFALPICAILIGSSLYRNLEFSPFRVKQPALSLVYFIALLFLA